METIFLNEMVSLKLTSFGQEQLRQAFPLGKEPDLDEEGCWQTSLMEAMAKLGEHIFPAWTRKDTVIQGGKVGGPLNSLATIVRVKLTDFSIIELRDVFFRGEVIGLRNDNSWDAPLWEVMNKLGKLIAQNYGEINKVIKDERLEVVLRR